MKNKLFYGTVVALIFAIGCGDVNIVEPTDPSIQRAIDIEVIEDYIARKGLNPVDTTNLGVRYIILDEGHPDSLAIDESDIVFFDYVGRLTNDSLFDTSIEDIAILSEGIYSEDRNYIPLFVTYSATGWTLPTTFARGFNDGIRATFNKLRVGGKSLVIIPSDLGFGTQDQFNSVGDVTIPANSVIVFELIPVEVHKQ